MHRTTVIVPPGARSPARRRRSRRNPEAGTDRDWFPIVLGAGVTLGLGTLAFFAFRRPASAATRGAVPVTRIEGAGWQTGSGAGGGRRARKVTSFHLRPSATADSVGMELATGTELSLLEQHPSIRRGEAALWRVRTPGGAEGWTFILPRELLG